MIYCYIQYCVVLDHLIIKPHSSILYDILNKIFYQILKQNRGHLLMWYWCQNFFEYYRITTRLAIIHYLPNRFMHCKFLDNLLELNFQQHYLLWLTLLDVTGIIIHLIDGLSNWLNIVKLFNRYFCVSIVFSMKLIILRGLLLSWQLLLYYSRSQFCTRFEQKWEISHISYFSSIICNNILAHHSMAQVILHWYILGGLLYLLILNNSLWPDDAI